MPEVEVATSTKEEAVDEEVTKVLLQAPSMEEEAPAQQATSMNTLLKVDMKEAGMGGMRGTMVVGEGVVGVEVGVDR